MPDVPGQPPRTPPARPGRHVPLPYRVPSSVIEGRSGHRSASAAIDRIHDSPFHEPFHAIEQFCSVKSCASASR